MRGARGSAGFLHAGAHGVRTLGSVARMSWRRAAPWIAIFAALAAAGGGCADRVLDSTAPGPKRHAWERPNATVRGTVVAITDGDTIRVRIDGGGTEKVRYIGIDTPETRKPGTPVQCFGKAATAANARLVGRRPVRLTLDVETRDRYDRLLAYVYRSDDGLFVNAALVRDGYATTLTIPPNVAHAGEFARLARRARARGAGLWSACG